MSKIICVGQIEVDTSLPYTDEEMCEAYDNFVSESKNAGEFDSCEEKLSQTEKSFFFSDPLTLCIRIVQHVGAEVGEFDRLPRTDKGEIFKFGGISLLASVFEKKHGLNKIVAWAMAVTAIRNFKK